VAVDRERRGKPGVAVLQLLFLPMTVATLLSTLAGPVAGLCGAVGMAAVVAIWWHRARRGYDCVFRVEEGELSVRSRGKGGANARMRLDELANVVLDTKAINRLQDGGSMIPGMRFVDGRVAPEVDVSRIMLVEVDGTSTALLERHIAHMDATEWVGKIRVFLRKQGWVPEDEREVASEAPKDDS
jgi:hypothetical protein